MSEIAVVVCLIALALVGALPRIFFRRGRLNGRWWLTAAPFVVAGATLAASLAGAVRSSSTMPATSASSVSACGSASAHASRIRRKDA